VRRKNIVVGILIVVVLGVVVYFWRTKGRNLQVPEQKSAPEAEQEIEERFNVVLPEDAEKIQLKDKAGKDKVAIATRKYMDNTFSMTLLADLPTPEDGKYYQGWIVRGDEGENNYSIFSLGRLNVAKGGFVVDFSSSKDYTNYNKVVVSLESTPDSQIEEIVLEGSF
jgi:hypothetical protein